jgi:hypothetical protein
MATIFLRHPIANYEAWRPHYDGDRPRREAVGLTEIGVYRNTMDPNEVLVMWSAPDVAGFNEMAASKGLQAKMQEAGVTGPPEIWIAK